MDEQILKGRTVDGSAYERWGKFLQQLGHLIRLSGKYGMPVTCNSAFYRLAHSLPELRLNRFNSQAAMKNPHL